MRLTKRKGGTRRLSFVPSGDPRLCRSDLYLEPEVQVVAYRALKALPAWDAHTGAAGIGNLGQDWFEDI